VTVATVPYNIILFSARPALIFCSYFLALKNQVDYMVILFSVRLISDFTDYIFIHGPFPDPWRDIKSLWTSCGCAFFFIRWGLRYNGRVFCIRWFSTLWEILIRRERLESLFWGLREAMADRALLYIPFLYRISDVRIRSRVRDRQSEGVVHENPCRVFRYNSSSWIPEEVFPK